MMNKVDQTRYKLILDACKNAINSGINVIKQSVGRADGGYRAGYRKTAHPLYALLLDIENTDTKKSSKRKTHKMIYKRRRWLYHGYDGDYSTFNSIFKKIKQKKRIPISWMVGFDYGLNYSYFRDKTINHKSVLEKMTFHVYRNHYGLTKKQIISWAKNKKELALFKRGFVVGEQISKDLRDPRLKDGRAKKSLRSAIKTALKAKVSEEDMKSILNECFVEEVLST